MNYRLTVSDTSRRHIERLIDEGRAATPAFSKILAARVKYETAAQNDAFYFPGQELNSEHNCATSAFYTATVAFRRAYEEVIGSLRSEPDQCTYRQVGCELIAAWARHIERDFGARKQTGDKENDVVGFIHFLEELLDVDNLEQRCRQAQSLQSWGFSPEGLTLDEINRALDRAYEIDEEVAYRSIDESV